MSADVVLRTPVHALRERLPVPLWYLYRVLRTCVVATAFIGFWSGGTILAWLVLPLVAVTARLRGRDPRRTCQRLLADAFRVFHGYMSLTRLFRVKLATPLDLARPSVLVANHTTLVDVTALFCLVPNLCCYARTPFARSPFVGRLLSLCGFIDAGTSMVERAKSLDEAAARLAEGFHVLVFPEGSRSPEGELHHFHRGPFELACRADAPLVPLFLTCDPSALRRDQRFWAQPDTCATLTISASAPVSPATFAHKSRPMRDALEARYRERIVGPATRASYDGTNQPQPHGRNEGAAG